MCCTVVIREAPAHHMCYCALAKQRVVMKNVLRFFMGMTVAIPLLKNTQLQVFTSSKSTKNAEFPCTESDGLLL